MDKDEEKAALVIQKHARGRKTRQSFRKAREIKAKTPRDGTVVDNLEAAAGVAAPAPAPCQA